MMGSRTVSPSSSNLTRDLSAGVVVFLVSLPLCLGIAFASNAPLVSGLVSGIVGGIVVGLLSGSQSSVSGPAAGLAAIVTVQLALLGSFPLFLTSLVLAGLIQLVLGVSRAGNLGVFFPSSVVKGLLAAIGCILVIKLLPHLFGRELDPQRDMSFFEWHWKGFPTKSWFDSKSFHLGSTIIGLISLALLIFWDRVPALKQSLIPSALLIVLLGVVLNLIFRQFGGGLSLGDHLLVQLPFSRNNGSGFLQSLQHPDWNGLTSLSVIRSALTIAAVASLETLINLEAIDKIDFKHRTAPPSRELVAQGVGNVTCGLFGGLPIAAVIVRSSLNVNAGNRTKVSAIFNGVLLLLSVLLVPGWLKLIPTSCLAAILLVTGFKLVSPQLFKRMWEQGHTQFFPFLVTLVTILLFDALTGILVGLAASAAWILQSNMRHPLNRVVERFPAGEVIRLQLPNQVSFLNRGSLVQALEDVPEGGQLLIDANNMTYIDPDVLNVIREYKDETARRRGVSVSLRGFENQCDIEDQTHYIEHSTKELQQSLSPREVLDILNEGHRRFLGGQQLFRSFDRQVSATGQGQHPLAVIVSCIDSRSPAELIFNLGLGDMFSVRLAGNVVSRKALGSIEYGCAVAGAKLVLVLGHTKCGAVTASVSFASSGITAVSATGCDHIDEIVEDIQLTLPREAYQGYETLSADEKAKFVDDTAKRNVARVVDQIHDQSAKLRELVEEGRIAVIGAMYDVVTGKIEYIPIPEWNSALVDKKPELV